MYETWTIDANDEHYPRQLTSVSTLYGIGDAALLDRPAIAITGTRRQTPYGRLVAERTAQLAVEEGVTVVTGAGIGGEHTVAKTVAEEGGDLILVTLGGPNVDYPEGSKDILDYAREHGLVVSATPPTTPPMPGKVPARRHMLAAICSAMLVTEAAPLSGALSAARVAMEYERDVYTVPGSIFSYESLGTNNLAKEGAMLVTCEHDITLILTKLRMNASSTGHRTICEILEEGPATAAKLKQETECGTSELFGALAQLEMRGIVEALPDGRWALHGRSVARTSVAKPNRS